MLKKNHLKITLLQRRSEVKDIFHVLRHEIHTVHSNLNRYTKYSILTLLEYLKLRKTKIYFCDIQGEFVAL